jgi:hypothetical protein
MYVGVRPEASKREYDYVQTADCHYSRRHQLQQGDQRNRNAICKDDWRRHRERSPAKEASLI